MRQICILPWNREVSTDLFSSFSFPILQPEYISLSMPLHAGHQAFFITFSASEINPGFAGFYYGLGMDRQVPDFDQLSTN
jgi:hypothetical protein